jgi:hypothetical protein
VRAVRAILVLCSVNPDAMRRSNLSMDTASIAAIGLHGYSSEEGGEAVLSLRKIYARPHKRYSSVKHC